MVRKRSISIHRAEPIVSGNAIRFDKLQENPQNFNAGILYRLWVEQQDAKTATLLGWHTGYHRGDCGIKNRQIGIVYAPQGFKQDAIVFVDSDDSLLGTYKFSHSLNTMLKHEYPEIAIKAPEGFSLIGFLRRDYIG